MIALLVTAFRADVHRSAAARSRRPGGRGLRAFAGLLVLAGLPARPSAALAGPASDRGQALPPATILPSKGVATQLTPSLARQITADLVADFKLEAEALRNRDKSRAAAAAGGERLQGLWQQIGLARQSRTRSFRSAASRACSSTSRPPCARRRRS